jgi:integrase
VADISKGKRKYYRATYYDAAGRRRHKSTKCTGARAAQAVADRFEREAQGAGYAAENATTIADALDAMLDYFDGEVLAGKRSAATRTMHQEKAGHWHRLFVTQGKANGVDLPSRLCELQARHIDAYIAERRLDGASENTIAKELVTMRVTLKVAKRAGDWSGDVDAVLPVRFAPEYKPRERWLTRAELTELLDGMTHDHAARVCYAVATSANLGETNAAKRSDWANGMVRLWGTKRTSRQRDVPVFLEWQRELLAFAHEHAQGDGDKLFAFDKGFESALRYAWEGEDPEAPRLVRCSSNDLRRTFAHWMRQSGVSRELVAAMMGHGSTAMVDKVYGKLDGAELAGLLQRALRGDTTVAQTIADRRDSCDSRDGEPQEILNDSGAGRGTRTHTPVRVPDFESGKLHLPTPREYERKRSYGKASDTTVAQQGAPKGVVVAFPRTARRGGGGAA